MHICLVMAGNEEGGLENHVISLCNQFSQQFKVTLIAHPKYADRLDTAVQFIDLPMHLGRRNPLLLLQLWRRINRLSADIIHAHGNKAAALLATIKPLLSIPCIATVHSLKRKTWMFERMDGVIGVSNGVLEPVNHPKQQVVYNGVNPYTGPIYDKAELLNEWQLDQSQPLCIAVGRLVAVKAYDLLIKAWVDQQASLAIIGEGSEQNSLQQLIDQHGLQDKVKLVGQRSDVAKILPAADLLAISSDREGFSLVMVESLLAGTAIVSTRVPGCREILPSNYLSDCGNPVGLAERLTSALADPEQLRREYQPVFDFAQQQLTTDSMLQQTLAYYRKILTGADE